MAHIVEFTIKGLAGRTEPLYRALDPHVNIFWGLNGRGKTSLLRILDSALQNDSGTIFNVPFTSAEILIEVPEHGATIRRTVSIEDINKETDVIHLGFVTSLEMIPLLPLDAPHKMRGKPKY